MAIRCGYFNSIDNDRTYNADDMSNYFKGLISDGVYATVGNACIVKSIGGLTLSVGTGRAIINNKWVSIDSPQTLQITPHTSLNRYDAICLQCNMNERKVSLVIVEGTPATEPQLPVRTYTSSTQELVLAHIYVKANADKITQSDITDRRAISSYCGWVTGLIKQVDTSELFLQFQTSCEEKLKEFEACLSERKLEYQTWFNNLTESLTVNVSSASSQIYEVETDENGYAKLPFTWSNDNPVHVYINGLFAVEGKDYQIKNGGIQLSNLMFDSGSDVITFVVFKAGVISGSGGTDDTEISASDIQKMISDIEKSTD